MKAIRIRAGITQSELAARIGTTQSAIARMERAGADTRFATVSRALEATGLKLTLEPSNPPVDLGQIDRHLAMSPAERLRTHDVTLRNTNDFLRLARRVSP